MLNVSKGGPPDASGFAIGDLTGDGKNEIFFFKIYGKYLNMQKYMDLIDIDFGV